MLTLIWRTSIAAVIVLALFGSPVAAGDDDSSWVTKDKNRPGLDLVIKDSSASDGKRQSLDTRSVERPISFNDFPGVNTCGGNIGASSSSIRDLSQLPVCSDAGGEDAESLARSVRDRLDLATPQIRTSPEAPVKALVGLETWMWVPSSQWKALTESATLGGTTVTVRAEPISTRWDMGEATKFCPNPGREWRKGLGQDTTTPCGYTYQRTSLRQPDNKFRIIGQIRYAVTWTCSGDCSAPSGNLGTIDSAASTAALEVGERHSVVIR